jgi:hypothetical protein
VSRAIDGLLREIALLDMEQIDLKDLFMCFLLALNDDFDDDLLQDAMELLVDI